MICGTFIILHNIICNLARSLLQGKVKDNERTISWQFEECEGTKTSCHCEGKCRRNIYFTLQIMATVSNVLVGWDPKLRMREQDEHEDYVGGGNEIDLP